MYNSHEARDSGCYIRNIGFLRLKLDLDFGVISLWEMQYICFFCGCNLGECVKPLISAFGLRNWYYDAMLGICAKRIAKQTRRYRSELRESRNFPISVSFWLAHCASHLNKKKRQIEPAMVKWVNKLWRFILSTFAPGKVIMELWFVLTTHKPSVVIALPPHKQQTNPKPELKTGTNQVNYRGVNPGVWELSGVKSMAMCILG